MTVNVKHHLNILTYQAISEITYWVGT